MKIINNNRNLISKIVTMLLVTITLLCLGFILKMNILPTKIVIVLIVGLILLVGLLSYLLLNPKINKNLKVGTIIVSIISMILLIISLTYGFKTLKFLDNLYSKSYKTETYHIVISKNSEYNSISDLNGKTIGYLINSNNSQQSIAKLEEVISFNKKGYNDLTKMTNDLLNQAIAAIVIEDSYKTIIEDQNKNYKDNAMTIYSTTREIETPSISNDVNVTTKPFNIYISGIDTYGSISSVSRSDLNIVGTINPNTYQILLTSIPRDYYVYLHDITVCKDKLSHAGIYGIDMSVQTVEDLLDTEINYYIKVNFSSLITLIDTIGSIDVNSKYAFTSIDGYHFATGYNHLNGLQTLSFVRERQSLPGGDRARGENQKAVIEAIIKKLASPVIITKYDSILKSLAGSFATNMPADDILSLLKLEIDKTPAWKVQSISLNGTDTNNYTYTYGSEKLYVMEPDMNTVNSARASIKNIITN